jgi:1-acyl-sn-glycerol-3-phosphate acyltransferase
MWGMVEWIVYGTLTCGIIAAVFYWWALPALSTRTMGDRPTAVLWYLNTWYVRLVHRLQATGTELIPNSLTPGPLVVICNHQSPIDPLLVQSQCRFKIRWLMAKEYMIPAANLVWKLSEVIPVTRDGQDSAGLRIAIRCLKENGVIGLFPEGGIKEPRCHVHPFLEGAGAMIAKTQATVLLAVVDGTPTNDDMGKALRERSNSKVTFIDLITFPEHMTGAEITSQLRARIAETTQWPLVH